MKFTHKLSTLLLAITLAAPLAAQEVTYDFQPVLDPIPVTRGSVMISKGQDALVLNKAETCRFAMAEWGWSGCETIETLIVSPLADVDSTLVEVPNSDGFVELEDWGTSERAEVVTQIEESLSLGAIEQGKVLGQTITFEGWLVEPTLNVEKNYMYYASRFNWAGQPQINIKATVFDRRGYVAFSIMPLATTVSPAEVESMITATLDQYVPTQTEARSAFTTGDTVAAVGAVGVLAGLAGLQYGKGAAGGAIAIVLLLLKKAWFLLLAPLYFIKNLFRRKPGPDA